MFLNSTKTKSMILTENIKEHDYPTTIVNIEGVDIDNVIEFKFLGSTIHYDPKTQKK